MKHFIINGVTASGLGAVAISLMLPGFATGAGAQTQDRVWTVTCGLPMQDNPFLELFPTGGYTGPWFGDLRSGHLEVKTLSFLHAEGGISTEMWLLSRTVGWWRLKAIRVHPDDRQKLSENVFEDANLDGIRQIIDSPFLAGPVIVRAGNSDDEELVNGQILAILPDARQLRCDPEFDGSNAARVTSAQRALARQSHDPGPIDGRMGPRTRAALRAFQTQRGLAPNGQLDDATFERLTSPISP